MTGVVLQMQALVQVAAGARVYYNCPQISGESFESDNFFRKYRGKTGIIKGFSEKLVGPLDGHGRIPGVYIQPGYITVQFEGEEQVHSGLNLDHFVLIDRVETVVPTIKLDKQRVRDLPVPIAFWPGDQVRKLDDLLQVIRIVEDVKIQKDGSILYELTETIEVEKQRVASVDAKIADAREKAKAGGDPMAAMPLMLGIVGGPKNERCDASNLTLVARGNVYHVYHDPFLLSFNSPADEAGFWMKDGISTTVFGKNISVPRWEWSFEEARQMVEQGVGDLIIASRRHKNVTVAGRGGDFQVRKLHPCFMQHQERVRALSLNLETPPTEGEFSFRKGALALFGKH